MPAEPRARMHFVLSGRGTLEAANRTSDLGPYTLILVPPNLAHRVDSSSEPMAELVELPEADVSGIERIVSGHGEPSLIPLWTAHASLFLTLVATGCWVVALAHLVVSVPRVFGLTKAPGTSRTDS